jgi:hypothetical protein
MDAAGPRTIVSDDHLQAELDAALAEIEKMSERGPGAGAPLDGADEPNDSPSQDISRPPPSPSVSTEPARTSDSPAAESDAPGATGSADEGWVAPPETIDRGATRNGACETPVATVETRSEQTEQVDLATTTPIEELFADIDPDNVAGEPPDKPLAPNDGSPQADQGMAAPPTEVAQTSKGESAADSALDTGGEDRGASLGCDGHAPVTRPETPSGTEYQLADEELTVLRAELEESSAGSQPHPPQHTLDDKDTPDRPIKSESLATPGLPGITDDEWKDVPAEPTGQAEPRKLRFQVGKKAVKERAAACHPPDQRREALRAIQPTTPLARRAFRLVDRVLDTINRPFERMGERTRSLAGYIALTTVLVSILAMILMPLILPHRSAVTFLLEKRAALDARTPSQETTTADATTPDHE